MIILMTNPANGREYKISPCNDLCFMVHQTSMEKTKHKWQFTGKYPADIPSAVGTVVKMMLNDPDNKDYLRIKPDNAYRTIKGYLDGFEERVVASIIVKLVEEDGEDDEADSCD